MLLPGMFVVLVTWLGARFALRGEITAGQLVAFYGYAAFLVSPLRQLTETIDKMTRGHVAARRVVRLLRLEPEFTDPARAGGDAVRPGAAGRRGVGLRGAARAWFTAIAADGAGGRRRDRRPARAVRRRRRSRCPACRLRDLSLAGGARADPGGRQRRPAVLRRAAGRSSTRTVAAPAAVAAALVAASATDVVEALPDGLDAVVAERGREFSGGQQQRLRLARALLADPDGAGAGRADQRGRRAHRGAHRRAARRRARRSHHRRLHHQPAGARPGRPRRLRRRRPGGRRGHPPRPARPHGRLRRHRDPRGGRSDADAAAGRRPTPRGAPATPVRSDAAATRGRWA